MERQRSRKRKQTNITSRLILIVAALALLGYVGKQVMDAFSGGYQTVAAIPVRVNDSFPATGWFFREETVVSASKSNAVKHVVYSGERVQQYAPLAIVYSDEGTMELSRQAEVISSHMKHLDAAAQSVGGVSDAAKVDTLIMQTIRQISSQIHMGSGTSLSSLSDSLRMLSLRRHAAYFDLEQISEERVRMQTERQNIERQIDGRTSEITSPYSGYYSEVVDGYESILRPERLKDMTLTAFQELLKEGPQKPQGDSLAMGKIIQGFSWYLAAEIPNEQAET